MNFILLPRQQTRSRFISTLTWTNKGKIGRHHWKERLKISKIAKFKSDLLKTKEDIAAQRR